MLKDYNFISEIIYFFFTIFSKPTSSLLPLPKLGIIKGD